MSSPNTERASSAVEIFAAGWRAPHPHAWDELLAADVELMQPLLQTGNGLSLWHEEVGRLLQFLPDLEGELLSWAAREDTLFIRLRLSATAGGKPVSFEAVDHLTLGEDGTVLRRVSHFDPLPMSLLLARRPGAWLRWWRSGVGPLLSRRRLLAGRRPQPMSHTFSSREPV